VLHWFILNVGGKFFKASFSFFVFGSDALMITVHEFQLKNWRISVRTAFRICAVVRHFKLIQYKRILELDCMGV
jgi:hypothetical protein